MNHHQAVAPRFALGLALWLALWGVGALSPAAGQPARDPTVPPPAVTAAPGEAAATLPISTDSLSVVVRDGKPMLVVGTRLYQQGQQIGAYRIERISETEVWLRNGRELHKIARFAGIERRAAAPERSTP
jgi:hypothetical protein